MQAIPSRVEFLGGLSMVTSWFSHHVAWLGAIMLAFFVGMGVNNGDANKVAVTSVQKAYAGKIQYHVQHEKAVATVAAKALDACKRNLSVALINDAALQDLKGCPPVPKK